MNESGMPAAIVANDRAASPGTREAQWRKYVQGVAAGDAGALASLYDESCSLVYGIALRVLRNEADAEEIASDVYSQVWRCASSFDIARGSVNAWLTTVARTRSIDRLRSRARAARMEGLDNLAEFPSRGETPEHASWLGQQRAKVREALQTLSAEQRQVIELAYFSGMSQSELAAAIQQPLGTVKTRIRLAMMKLRERLQCLKVAEQ
jgi:RNA polymerase sigma-70 factor, ECF subfamily